VTFVHFPIKDCGVTDDNGVLQLCIDLVKAISEGEVLYVHCWGGHGRTGTIISIMLHLMYGLGPEESMARCQTCHDLRKYPVQVGSPQTQQQR
jgi:protein-tyrosine phosphatase